MSNHRGFNPCEYDYVPKETSPCLDQDSYTHAPSCLNCDHNDICGCGRFGDKGICLLYKERATDD